MNKQVKILLIAGLVLTFLPPFIGLTITVQGMIGTFHTLGQHGSADPQQLSHHIGLALVATAVGIMVGFIGIVLLAAAAIVAFCQRQNRPSTTLGPKR